MKKATKKFFQIILISCLTLTAANLHSQATISPRFFGQNAWMPDTIGSAVYNGKLHKKWKEVQESGAAVVRFGGIAPDHNKPTNYQYIKMIDSIRARGMEPIIQVPFNKWQYSASQAAAIVQYVNVTKSRNVKYWIIGNEPDLGYSYTTAAQIANYIRPFSSAMKAVDPTIKIIGPETAWFNTNIINGLTSPGGPDDITGKDANGRYYIDVISFHTYPFNGSQTRSQVIAKLSAPGGLKDNLINLNGRIANCNSYHNRTGTNALKTAITEANINYHNPSGDDLYNVGANSFIGGQFVAEMMGVGMKYNLDFINIWSVIEGNTITNNIGYINPSDGKKKPLYHHFKLLADNFRGTFANGTSNIANVKTFGCKNAAEIAVLIMNQELSTNYNYTVKLGTGTVSGTNPLKLNIDAGLTMEYSEAIPAQSTVLLIFDVNGNILKKYEYSLNTHAASNLPPTLTNLAVTTGIQQTSGATLAIGRNFEIRNVFPVPAPGKFTLEVNRSSTSGDEDYEVQVFNMIGQEVFSKKLSFRTGQEEIELAPDISNGTYLLRVKEGSRENYLVKKIIIQKE